jgi:hypothetical protein
MTEKARARAKREKADRSLRLLGMTELPTEAESGVEPPHSKKGTMYRAPTKRRGKVGSLAARDEKQRQVDRQRPGSHTAILLRLDHV